MTEQLYRVCCRVYGRDELIVHRSAAQLIFDCYQTMEIMKTLPAFFDDHADYWLEPA